MELIYQDTDCGKKKKSNLSCKKKKQQQLKQAKALFEMQPQQPTGMFNWPSVSDHRVLQLLQYE